MVRTRLARTSISELKKRIILAQERKLKITQYLQEIWEKFNAGEISRDLYIETVHKHYDDKTPKEWIDYYDHYTSECERLIKKHKEDLVKNRLGVFILSFILIIFLLGVGLYTQPQFVGLVVQDEIPDVATDTEVTITTTQQQAILGQPVKWTKDISLDEPTTTKIRLPKEAENIFVNKISYSEENLEEVLLKEDSSPSQEEPLPSSDEAKFSITGLVTAEDAGIQGSFLSRFLRNFGRITGQAILEPEEKLEIEIDDTATEYEIEYETEAPYAIEEDTERGKTVQIIGPETVHYENVLSFTTLDENLNIQNPRNVRIYWREDDSFISPTSVQDTDNNGIYDYIEWIAPSLSTQTFDIIIITKAEHLDSNRNFISDIFNEVRELDNMWSETINDNEYVRATFETPLTSDRDITIYPRITSGNPKIEVYEFEGTTKIAEFTSINSNTYNKIFLDGSSGAGLTGEQDTFDLKILDGGVEFDHIVDPPQFARPDVTDSSTDWTVVGQAAFWDAVDEVTANGDTDYVNTTTDESEIHFNLTSVTDPEVNTSHILRVNSTVINGGGAGERFFFHLYQGYTLIASSPQTTQVDVVYTEHTYTLTDVEAEAITDYSDLRIQIDISATGPNEPQRFTQVFFEVPAAPAGDTEQPKWQFPSVNDTTPLPNRAVRHNINWTDDTALNFAILEVNSTGASCNTAANVSETTLSGLSAWANLTWLVPNACEGQVIGWKQWANDTANNGNLTDTQVYVVQNVNPETLFGTNPIDVLNSSSGSVTFEFKTSDNLNVDALRLYGNWTGTWEINQTNMTAVNDSYWNITVTGIPEGKNHVWAAWGNDTLGNFDFTDANRTFTVDLTAPVVGQKFVNTTSVNTGEAIRLNVTGVTDNFQLDTVYTTITYPNNTIINITMTDIGGNVFDHNLSVGSTAGTFYYNTTYANDTAGNLGSNTTIFSVTVASSNSPPTIDFVEAIAAQNPTDDTITTITFNFTATDTDTASDINLSSAQGFFTRTGEATRSNITCSDWASAGNDVNFTCTIDMLYFDENGAWDINVTVRDNSQVTAENSSTQFTYNILSAMKLSPTSLTWPTINLPDTNIEANENITINNTGNKINVNINVTALDLQGEITSSQFIFAENFTVESSPGTCSGTAMVNNTQVNITSAILQRGNHSLNFNNATSGQERIIFCLEGVPQDITSQPYSSSGLGAWTIRILLVAIIPASKKKKKKEEKENKLIDALDLSEYISLVDKLKEKVFSKEEIIKTIIEKLGKKYDVDREELLRVIKAREGITIPIGIFSKKLGALESLAKYMKENLDMNYREIAKELGRNERTIWTAYKKANEKQKDPIKPKETKINMPTSVLENRKLTILESIIIYLKQKGFKFSEIEKLIDRDQRNIGTIYSRAMKKVKSKK